jgi:toluene monooxygenase system protein E
MRRPPPPLRTYSHLGSGKIPSEYEIVSTRLLYYPARGFETNVPLSAWYERHQRGGQLRCADWEIFADPRETTYASYTAQAARHEQHLDAVASSAVAGGHDGALTADWLQLIDGTLSPLRFVWHGFQMIAAYVGQMAPSGRITLVALFQAGDEMRRIHRIAQRMTVLQDQRPSFGAQARADWQQGPAWQPLRSVIEHALVAYDWGEAFAALALCIKPVIDHLVLGELGAQARQRGDYVLGESLASFAEDVRWHAAWAAQLVKVAAEDRGGADGAGNQAALASWVGRWLPPAFTAAQSLAPLLGPGGDAAAGRAQATVLGWLRAQGLVAA